LGDTGGKKKIAKGINDLIVSLRRGGNKGKNSRGEA